MIDKIVTQEFLKAGHLKHVFFTPVLFLNELKTTKNVRLRKVYDYLYFNETDTNVKGYGSYSNPVSYK